MTNFIVTNNNDSDTGSLRWAVEQANANAGLDTIDFEVELVTLASAINVTDSVIFNGNNTTIDQVGSDRIFNINDDSDTLLDVTINGLTLEGGRPDELGGAIYTVENLTVNESVFKDNVTSKRGGGIYSEGAALTITNSLFEQNEVVGEYTVSSGGAFYIEDGILDVSNSSFLNNKSFISVATIAGGESTILDSTFDNNNGGAIFIADDDSTATIERTAIINNFGEISGAGIGIEEGAEVTITDSIIDNNESDYGGGIFVANATVEVTNSSVTNNTAKEAGGGIGVAGTGLFTILNSTISGNTAPIGSAVEVYGNYSGALVADVNITGNTGSDSQLEGNVRFGAGNTGGILELEPLEPEDLETPVEPEAPETPVVEPVVDPAEPVVDPVEPVVDPVEPVVDPVEPVIDPVEPVVDPVEPVVDPVEPVVDPVEPVVDPVEPVIDPVDPVDPSLNLVDVNRFYQNEKGFHFYTADSNESASIQAQSEAGELNYSYENVSYSALSNDLDALTGEAIEGAKPVYRFFNEDTGAHLYTMDDNEKGYINQNLDNYSFEGTAYYAFEAEQQELETIPVYRLLNSDTGAHLFSADANEVSYINQNLDNYAAEGINGVAFYALEVEI